MTAEQKRTWESEKRAVRRLRDGLGKPVDQAVIETVAILRLLGFHTTSSCGGHLDRLLSPYVRLTSPRGALYRELMYQAEGTRRRRVQRLAIKYNASEADDLLRYLERFYAARRVPLRQRLIVQGFGVVGYDLTTQSHGLLRVTSRDHRAALLQAERDELRAFTEFLKEAFFEEAALPGSKQTA